MILIKELDKVNSEKPTVVTLGKFDGLHRGHRKLIEKTVKDAGTERIPAVFAFDIAPMTLLTKRERRTMLEKMGISMMVECPFTPKIITMSPEAFVRDILSEKMHAEEVVVGPNFRFGYEREGNADTLRKLGKQYGFTVKVVPVVCDEEGEISSSRIRNHLAKGEMEKVNELLGYDFFVTGEIVHGNHIGRTLGVPTTNIIPEKTKLLPPNGVYASETRIGKRIYQGVTDIGTKPTVDGQFVGVETFLFDCSEDLYGEEEEVRILSHLRREKKFPSVEELKTQLKKDEKNGRAFFLDL